MFISINAYNTDDTYNNNSATSCDLVWIWNTSKDFNGNITCFFPILVSFVDGLENVDKDYLNLFKTMNASKLDTFIHLKFPMSIEKLFSGLKISATYAVMAATVAEWLGGTVGLGVYMVRSKKAYALDKVFASTILSSNIQFNICWSSVNYKKKILINRNV